MSQSHLNKQTAVQNEACSEEQLAERTERLRLRLSRKMLRTCKNYNLLSDGDRVMVAISGGKDSYTLLDLLHGASRRLPFKVEFIAVHLDQQQPGYDGAPLREWLHSCQRIPRCYSCCGGSRRHSGVGCRWPLALRPAAARHTAEQSSAGWKCGMAEPRA